MTKDIKKIYLVEKLSSAVLVYDQKPPSSDLQNNFVNPECVVTRQEVTKMTNHQPRKK